MGRDFCLDETGFLPHRRLNGRGGTAPHLSIGFGDHLFSIDTSRTPSGFIQPDAYLITHAHSDHYGRSAMLSPRAVASKETAQALQIRSGRRYEGRTFHVGQSIEICGVEVKTYSTGHTIGSCAFSWRNESGARILVTGDVKDYSNLPRCDLLVTEACYGDPWDLSCRFDDDLPAFCEAVEEGATFGAYAFGKAQRAAALIRAMGYKEVVGMDEECLSLTEALMPSLGPLSASLEGQGPCIVTPSNLTRKLSGPKYLLTGRGGWQYPTIRLSDHLDFRGLMRMIDKTSPSFIIVYHPGGVRDRLLTGHLCRCGIQTVSLEEIGSYPSGKVVDH